MKSHVKNLVRSFHIGEMGKNSMMIGLQNIISHASETPMECIRLSYYECKLCGLDKDIIIQDIIDLHDLFLKHDSINDIPFKNLDSNLIFYLTHDHKILKKFEEKQLHEFLKWEEKIIYYINDDLELINKIIGIDFYYFKNFYLDNLLLNNKVYKHMNICSFICYKNNNLYKRQLDHCKTFVHAHVNRIKSCIEPFVCKDIANLIITFFPSIVKHE